MTDAPERIWAFIDTMGMDEDELPWRGQFFARDGEIYPGHSALGAYYHQCVVARKDAALLAAEDLVHALNWCSGSNDFQEGGKARVGWERVVQPALAAFRTAGGRLLTDDSMPVMLGMEDDMDDEATMAGDVDISPEAVERLAAGLEQAYSERLGLGSVKSAEATALRALSARLAEAEAALDSKHAEVGSNIWRFWRDKAMETVERNKVLKRERDEARAARAAVVEEAETIPIYMRDEGYDNEAIGALDEAADRIRALASDADRDALARVRAEERKRCAKVAETSHYLHLGEDAYSQGMRAGAESAAKEIAAAIMEDDT